MERSDRSCLEGGVISTAARGCHGDSPVPNPSGADPPARRPRRHPTILTIAQRVRCRRASEALLPTHATNTLWAAAALSASGGSIYTLRKRSLGRSSFAPLAIDTPGRRGSDATSQPCVLSQSVLCVCAAVDSCQLAPVSVPLPTRPATSHFVSRPWAPGLCTRTSTLSGPLLVGFLGGPSIP